MRHLGRDLYEWWEALPDTPKPAEPNTAGWIVWLAFLASISVALGVAW